MAGVRSGGGKVARRKVYTYENYGPVDREGYSAYQKQSRPGSPWEAEDARDRSGVYDTPEQDQ